MSGHAPPIVQVDASVAFVSIQGSVVRGLIVCKDLAHPVVDFAEIGRPMAKHVDDGTLYAR